MKEKELYKPVSDFIKKEWDCFSVYITKGPASSIGIIDVIGIRYVMGNYGGHSEIIAVEVKPENATFLKSAGQAYAYSVMADRCYLAVHKPKRPFSNVEMDLINKLGLGLIQIDEKNKCSITVSAPLHEPLRSHRLDLLWGLGLVECVICKSLFKNDEMAKSDSKKNTIAYAIDEKKPFRYWLYNLAETRNDNRPYIYDKRHICSDCVQAFSALHQRK